MTLDEIYYLVILFCRLILYVWCSPPVLVFDEYPGLRRVLWVVLASCDVY